MPVPSNQSAVTAAKLSEGFAVLSDLPNDVIRYALARMHGYMEYQIKYANRRSFSVDTLIEMMKSAAESQTPKTKSHG